MFTNMMPPLEYYPLPETSHFDNYDEPPADSTEQLLTEPPTLASVYHKPPESFVAKGRYGVDEIQRAAIQEQRQNLAENPIAASVAAAATANGCGNASQSNIENLLDIDIDGVAPASAEHNPAGTGTPDRVVSPAATGGLPGAPSGGRADIMGLVDAPSAGSSTQSPPPGVGNVMDSFAGMNLSRMSAPPGQVNG